MRALGTSTANIFTSVILTGTAITLALLAYQRHQDFRLSIETAANKATLVASAEIRKHLDERERLVKHFVRENEDAIKALTREPDNFAVFNRLNDKMNEIFPDHLTINIASSSGELLIDDFEGNVGEICRSDLKTYVETGRKIVRVHPNYNLYHYDVSVGIKFGDEDKLFFASFGLGDVASVLHLAQPDRHRLMVVLKDQDILIEITDSGGRNTITDRNDYRLTPQEKQRILSSSPVSGSEWYVIDLHKEDLFESNRNALLVQSVIIYFIFIVMVIVMRRYLEKEEHKRIEAEEKLISESNKVRDLNEKLLGVNQELEAISITDDLTGVYNRRYFDRRVNEEWNRAMRNGYPVTIVMFDVDHFKQYNDYYGHQKGDECLKRIADIMRSRLKRAEDFMARYGGEEFAAVITSGKIEDIAELVDKIRCAVEEAHIEHKRSDTGPWVTVSAGLSSIVPTVNDTLDQLLIDADRNLYHAKAGGRNRVISRVSE